MFLLRIVQSIGILHQILPYMEFRGVNALKRGVHAKKRGVRADAPLFKSISIVLINWAVGSRQARLGLNENSLMIGYLGEYSNVPFSRTSLHYIILSLHDYRYPLSLYLQILPFPSSTGPGLRRLIPQHVLAAEALVVVKGHLTARSINKRQGCGFK